MPADSPPSSPTAFASLVDGLDYPMFVVSAADGDDADACLVGFATQCSIEPSRFLVCLSKNNHTYDIARRTFTLVVHRLRSDQHDVAEHFGAKTELDDPSKLAAWPWRSGPDDTPVIDDCDWFAGRVQDRFDTGDHVAFVLAPFDGECPDPAPNAETGQLGYRAVRDLEAGRPA
jgi:flavin reductase (DIM6/NTAB) family NADH-FMN oxidoreductase RutF